MERKKEKPRSGLGNPPFSLLTACFRVDYVQSRLTGEVFEILKKEMVSPGSRKSMYPVLVQGWSTSRARKGQRGEG